MSEPNSPALRAARPTTRARQKSQRRCSTGRRGNRPTVGRETNRVGAPIEPSEQKRGASRLLADDRGSIFAEYVVLLSVVAMVCVAALILAGIPLVRNFYMQTAIIGLPVP